MSRWQEYGFPYLTGVSFQTALQGLLCALRERLQAEKVSGLAENEILDICEKVNAYPIYQAVRKIEALFDRMNSFFLPDGAVFSTENAAFFLQEELVSVAEKSGSSAWSCPWSGMMYEWLAQRYRFLNLAYQISPAGYLASCCSRELWQGQGMSFSEAVSKLEYDSGSEAFYTVASGSVVSAKSGDSWSVEKLLCVPSRVLYPFDRPCLLCWEIVPQMSTRYCGEFTWDEEAEEFTVCPESGECRKWVRDDFGLGMTFNTPQIFFSRQVSEEAEFCSTIEIPELRERVLTLFRNTVITVPPAGYQNSRLVRGFEAQFRWFGDFRNTFEFYDPIGEDTTA